MAPCRFARSSNVYNALVSSDEELEDDEPCLTFNNEKELRDFFRNQNRFNKNMQSEEPHSFEPRHVGFYPIPKTLTDAVDETLPTHQIEQRIAELMENIDSSNIDTYAKFFHTMLFLEEIQILKFVRDYNHTRAMLRRDGKWFVFDIQNHSQSTQFLNLGNSVRVIYEGDEHYGRIAKLDDKSVFMRFKRDFIDEYEFTPVEIQFQFNRLNFVRQHIAIDYANEELGPNIIMPSEVVENDIQLDVHLTEEGKLMQGDNELKWYNKDLNNYQRQAVANIMQGKARPSPYVIFGPPGTGKTSTLIETILQIFDNVKDSKLLITTPSNNGADSICESLLRNRAFNENEMVRLLSYCSLVKCNGKVANEIAKYCALVDTTHPKSQSKEYDEEEVEMEHNIRNKLMLSEVPRFRIIITTCNLMGCMQLREDAQVQYSHIFIDEAGQCSEPEALIPISFMHETNGQIVLAGDPKQLGPVVFSIPAKQNLGKSLLGRILDMPLYQENFINLLNESVFDSRLVTGLLCNYRALPSILNVYNDMFYNSRLISTICNDTSAEVKLLNKLSDSKLIPAIGPNKYGVCFHNVYGKNTRITNSHSWCNIEEKQSVYEFVLKLYKMNIGPDDIGIISPYKLQVLIIKAEFERNSILAPKIGSVEEFQGQERNIILVSTVRSCPSFVQRDTRHLFGFVQSPQRLNVAISRARALLVIFGNADLLQRDENWRNVLKGCYRNQAYFGVPFPASLIEEMNTETRDPSAPEQL